MGGGQPAATFVPTRPTSAMTLRRALTTYHTFGPRLGWSIRRLRTLVSRGPVTGGVWVVVGWWSGSRLRWFRYPPTPDRFNSLHNLYVDDLVPYRSPNLPPRSAVPTRDGGTGVIGGAAAAGRALTKRIWSTRELETNPLWRHKLGAAKAYPFHLDVRFFKHVQKPTVIHCARGRQCTVYYPRVYSDGGA